MRRQGQWFWGILLTALLATVGLGLLPVVNPSFSGSSAPSPPASDLLAPGSSGPSSSSVIGSFGSAVAQAQEPGAIAPTLFTDPSGQYEMALLEGYQAYSVANTTVVEAPDGSLAYTVVIVPTFDPEAQLTDAALARLARETFQQGEGFITKEFQPTQSGIKVNWQGRVTTRGAQPLSGSIFARQEGDQVLLLLIAATEAGQTALDEAIAILPPSLQLLNP